jgi:hypothetical protein
VLEAATEIILALENTETGSNLRGELIRAAKRELKVNSMASILPEKRKIKTMHELCSILLRDQDGGSCMNKILKKQKQVP